MARPPISLSQEGGNFMWPTKGETAPEGSYHYALNLVPETVARPNVPWVQRARCASAMPLDTAVGGNVVAMGQLFTVDGTGITWLLSSSSGLWSLNWATGTTTNVVTAGNFTTAGVTLAASTHYWCVFNNKIAFNPSNGTQKPWTWDGTAGAGGIAELNNAPFAYGRPTTYYAKLFFIEYAARDTIAWSEENDATTGYATGGFSNEWKLSQTGTAPIYAIQGTNEALYYFREKSIGLIRGAVSTDFVTSGTHDAIPGVTGTICPNGVAAIGGDLWFADQYGLPNFLPAGGAPRRVMEELDAVGTVCEPFGFDDIGWDRSTGASITSKIEVLVVPPQLTMPYETVWFSIPSTGTATRAFLVCDRASVRPLSWFLPYTGAAIREYVSVVRNSTTGMTHAAVVEQTNGRLMYFGKDVGPDSDAAGNTGTTTWRLIGAPLGNQRVAEFQFDRIAIDVGDPIGATLGVRLLTSRRRTVTDVGASQSVALTADATYAALKRYVVGLNQNGRWCRPVLTVTSGALVTRPRIFGGWTVWAYPVSTSPTVP